MCKPRFCSQGVIPDGFETKKVKEKKTLKALETPPPLMAKVMKNYHFFGTLVDVKYFSSIMNHKLLSGYSRYC